MNASDYADLALFLNGYFHQDWGDDHATEADVVLDYVRSTWRHEVMRTVGQLEQYLKAHPIHLLVAFNRDFSPMIVVGESDDEAKRWLEQILFQMRSNIAQSPERPA